MKNLYKVLMFGLLTTSTSHLIASTTSQLTGITTKTTAHIIKSKKDYCIAIGNSIRNIRSIKLLQQELDKYSIDALLDCLKKLAADPTLSYKIKQLQPYIEGRQKN